MPHRLGELLLPFLGVIAPDRATFLALARRHRVVPVWRKLLADVQTPVAAFLRLDSGEDAFLLESVEGGERWGRYSFLGVEAAGRVVAHGGGLVVSGDAPVAPVPDEPPLAYLRRLLAGFDAPDIPGLPPLRGGAVGYIGYDCVRELERLPHPPQDDLGLPDMALLITRTFVVFDHLEQSAYVVSNAFTGDDVEAAYETACAACESATLRLSAPLPSPPVDLVRGELPPVATSVSDDEFAAWVRRAKDHIVAGDVFQVVPSRRFEVPLTGTAFSAYRVLRTINPSPYMYFLRVAAGDRHPGVEIAGSSPEPLVRVVDETVVTRPIAGTRARGAGEDEDLALEQELRADAKERAEHTMLVDLARNDVGRVARYGTVTVDELMVVERYSHVMHLVSSVSGRLRPDRTAFDALTACFPAGTVTGAPKVRAMEIIDELEKTRRGPYAGVVGYFDFSGNLDACITIRSIVATGGRAFVQAGAGVVADSVPEHEAAETRAKAEALLRACGDAAALRPYSNG